MIHNIRLHFLTAVGGLLLPLSCPGWEFFFSLASGNVFFTWGGDFVVGLGMCMLVVLYGPSVA